MGGSITAERKRQGKVGLEGRSKVMAKTRSRPYKATKGKSARGFILDSWDKGSLAIESMATGVGPSQSFLPECHCMQQSSTGTADSKKRLPSHQDHLSFIARSSSLLVLARMSTAKLPTWNAEDRLNIFKS